MICKIHKEYACRNKSKLGTILLLINGSQEWKTFEIKNTWMGYWRQTQRKQQVD